MGLKETTEEILDDTMKKAAREAWENKSHLLKLLGRAWDFFRGRPPGEKTTTDPQSTPRPILILGPGGTGKTTLARVLAGDVNVLLDPPPYYDPSLFAESVPLLGEPGAELVVVPGETYRHERAFDRLCGELVKGTYRGVILVVDYGYHAIKSAWAKDHSLFEKSKKEFVPKLVAQQRQEETALLDKLVPSLKAVTGKLWVLVVVLKQDLWDSKQADVIKHYEQEDWGRRMNEVLKALDGKPFYLHTVYACLHIQNYTTSGGRETLQKNTPGYDAVRQRQSLAKLFEAFDALREWEEKP